MIFLKLKYVQLTPELITNQFSIIVRRSETEKKETQTVANGFPSRYQALSFVKALAKRLVAV